MSLTGSLRYLLHVYFTSSDALPLRVCTIAPRLWTVARGSTAGDSRVTA